MDSVRMRSSSASSSGSTCAGMSLISYMVALDYGSVLDARGRSAVDDEVGAGGVAGHGAGEEGDAGGDLLGLAEAAERVELQHALIALGLVLLALIPDAAFEEDRAGRHRVDADALLRDVVAQMLHIGEDRRLHRRIRLARAIDLHRT